MSNRIRKVFYPWFFIILLIGCSDIPDSPVYQKEISVFGFLWGDRPLNKENGILITYTKPITDYYDPAQAAIADAAVTIKDLQRGVIYRLYPAAEYPGYFYNDSLVVACRHTYRLEIRVDDQTVSATTTVPPRLGIESELRTDQMNYYFPMEATEMPPIYLQCENEKQIIYVDMFCNQTYSSAEYIRPFNEKHLFPQNQEEYDGGRNGPPRHIWTFMRFQDLMAPAYSNRHVIYWYRAMFVFYGSNTMQVLAIDDNYHRTLYSEHPELSGGVQGGIGVFGAVSGDKYDFIVQKKGSEMP